MVSDDLPFNVTDLVVPDEVLNDDGTPPVNLMVIECEVCRERLINLLTRWAHPKPPEGEQWTHVPVPVPRMTQPVIPPG